MANPLEGIAYVQQQGELGRQRGTQNRLAQLASQAFGAAPADQRGLVQQAIAADPSAGFALNTRLGDDRQARMGELSQKARLLVGYAKAGNRAGVDALYPQLAAEAQAIGLAQGIPTGWDDSYLPAMEQLASLGIAGAAAPAGLREFEAMTQGLSADERERARRIHLGLEGRASNAGMGFGTFRDAQGFDRPQRNNPRSGQVEIWYDEQGRWVPLGEAVDGASQPPMQTRFTGADGTPVSIGADIPANVAADIMRNEAQWATAPDMATAHLPEQRVAQFSGTPAGLGRGRRPEDESAARRAAEQAVDLQFAPAKAEAEAEAAARRKAAEQSVERMPPAVLKTVTELEERASTADGIRERMQEHRRKIEEGKLDFGPVANQMARARNFAGNSNEQSRNFQLFMSDLEKMRNDSLRLNNGVQTEGDAQRAWNELFANLNDREYVLAGLDRIDRINQRAAELYRNQAANIRAEYPASGTGMYAPAPSDGPADAAQPGSGWSIQRVR